MLQVRRSSNVLQAPVNVLFPDLFSTTRFSPRPPATSRIEDSVVSWYGSHLGTLRTQAGRRGG